MTTATMHLLLLHLLIPFLLAGLGEAARKLTPPADVQLNLLFPRPNETYAPTQYFPVVFGIQNLDVTGPINAVLDVIVSKYDEDPNKEIASMEIHYLHLSEGTFNQTFFHRSITSMTNNTIGRFIIAWKLKVYSRCWDTEEEWHANDPMHQWDNGVGDYGGNQVIDFFTEHGAQLPDIESALNACDEPSPETDIALRITSLRHRIEADRGGAWGFASGPQVCPVFSNTSVEANRCAYKSFATALAANISENILGRMYCEEGTWQTMQGECPPEGDAIRSAGVRWIIALVLAAAVGWLL